MWNITKMYAWYFCILAVCVVPGDGRWKRKDREKLEQDIKTFHKLAERIEEEIETFYDEYPTQRSEKDNAVDVIKDMNLLQQKKISKEKDFLRVRKTLQPRHNKYYKDFLQKNNTEIYDDAKIINSNSLKFTNIKSVQNKNYDKKWPSFEDMLHAIGKRYDWKNDRWIKVKEKPKASMKNTIEDSHFYAKHKFSYSTVKLNRTKSKKNIVVAVTAVR